MAKKLKSIQSGFGVIEVVITMFLIGASLLLFQSTANSLVLNKFGRYREVALRIADQKMQIMRTIAFVNLPASGSFADPRLSSIPGGQANLTVTDINNLLKDVVVTVSWDNPQGTGREQVQLETYITLGGIGQ